VLEVGCGTGVDVAGMVEAVGPDGRVVATDSSELAVEAARDRAARWPEVSVQVADAHELPFGDSSFEACRVDRTMLHLHDPVRALTEMRRVLVPAGRLGILEAGCSLDGDPALVDTPVHRAVAARYWSPDQASAQINPFLPLLLRQAGFDDVRVERLGWASGDFAAADALMRLQDGAAAVVAREPAARTDVAEWLAAVHAAMDGGTVGLRWEAVLLRARRPELSGRADG
jgi:SAM-dependent methyltransferase